LFAPERLGVVRGLFPAGMKDSCNLANSALACLKTGMSGSASFQGEEFLVGGLRFGFISRQGECSADLQMHQSAHGIAGNDSAVI
jgi:hypothetical protein